MDELEGMTRRELGSSVLRAGLTAAGSAAILSSAIAAPNEQQDDGALNIGMLVYPQMTALDLVGPLQILASLRGAKIHLVWKKRDVVVSDAGMPVQPTTTFEDCPKNLSILFAPGGTVGTIAVMNDDAALDFMAQRGETAKLVTSVCTGALILGAAGLLKGYKATTHWVARDQLALFGAEPVMARVVEDRNRITGAGVTAGLDFGLRIAAKLQGVPLAKTIQLGLEYDPDPPFQAGSPEGAGKEIADRMRNGSAPLLAMVKAAAERTKKRRA